MSWRHPFSKKTITSRWGATANRPTPHRGLDYAPGNKTVIPAVADGEIVFIGWSDCLGHVVVQKCRASNGQIVFVGYCHLLSKPGSYKVGDFRRAGDSIQKVGNTGSCSRGAHLHLTIGPKVDSVFLGVTVNPEKFIDEQIKRCAGCAGCCQKG
jgi:murein DD-endopeptidase MepM/ murein hydrolase activator NlpD